MKICFPQYFGITRRYMQKKILFLGNYFPPQKKRSFSRDFSRRPAFGHGRLGHPQSLEYSKFDFVPKLKKIQPKIKIN